nr:MULTISPECIES: ABC transporter ATP-binding protein [unclassified Archaeoglobus]
MIELREVWKSYIMGKVEVNALRGVNLQVESGEFVVVLGPSGCGKTTMLNIIGGIDRPTKGRVIFDGRDITDYDDNALTMHRRKNVGFIFQFFNLIPTLTARENVEIAADLVEKSRDVEEVLEVVGLKERASHFPAELSGGEQQRVAIARALVKNPPIILADEPTGSLDFETGKAILGVMREINVKEGITFILVTHNSAIAAIADKVVYLRDGKVERVVENLSPVKADEIRW